MSSPVPTRFMPEGTGLGKRSDDNVGNLDVGWLLHSKKGEYGDCIPVAEQTALEYS